MAPRPSAPPCTQSVRNRPGDTFSPPGPRITRLASPGMAPRCHDDHAPESAQLVCERRGGAEIAGTTSVRTDTAAFTDDANAYEVVIADDGVPVAFLTPPSPDDWQLALDLRATDFYTPAGEWAFENAGDDPAPMWQPEFDNEDHRPSWAPQFEDEPHPLSRPPPPPREHRSPSPTRPRRPRARRTSEPTLGPAPQRSSCADGKSSDDSEPEPAPASASECASPAPPFPGDDRRSCPASRRTLELPTPIPPRDSTPWLTAREAAYYLRLPSIDALYQDVRRGRVPVHPRGRRFLFHRDELDALLLGGTKVTSPATISSGVRRHRGGSR